MKQNFKLVLEYDGSRYHGWQRQTNEATIQGEIEKALTTMTGKHISLIGSGRTDAGVHAFGQTANFHCDTRLTPVAFQKGLNSLLPKDIVVHECTRVNDDFHARFNVTTKHYQYRIHNSEIPKAIYRQYAWHVIKKLDIKAIQKAGRHLVGIHDFKSFQGNGSDVKNTVRRINTLNFYKNKDQGLERDKDIVKMDIEGDGFLKHMVRNIIGTLVDVGAGKITPDEVKQILEAKDRSKAGITAPAHGLFLMKVTYGTGSQSPPL